MPSAAAARYRGGGVRKGNAVAVSVAVVVTVVRATAACTDAEGGGGAANGKVGGIVSFVWLGDHEGGLLVEEVRRRRRGSVVNGLEIGARETGDGRRNAEANERLERLYL